MSPVRLCFRAELRANRRAWIGLALLIGAGAGASMAAATGARRTETAFPRFVEQQRTPDIVTGGAAEGEEEFLAGIEALKTLPQVAEWHQGYGFPSEIRTASGRVVSFPKIAPGGQDAASQGPRPKLLRGRYSSRSAPDEATISFAAEGPELSVGDRVVMILAVGEEQRQVEVPIRIVGVHASPSEFQSLSGFSFPGLHLGPGVIEAIKPHIKQMNPSDTLSVEFRLKRGAADVAAFRAEADRRGIAVDLPLETAELVGGVQKTMRLEAAALWLLSGLVALAAVAIFGQALARVSLLEAAEFPALRALGVTRTQLVSLGVLRASVIGAWSAAVAVVVCLAGSALTPIGYARIAEPSPGVRVDPLVLVLGAGATALLCVALALLPSVRASRLASSRETEEVRHSSLTTSLLRRATSPSVVSGLRLALERGRGRTAVPVRTTILGAALGVTAMVMALTFQASLARLVVTPQLFGYTWDALVAGSPEQAAELRRDSAIEALTAGGLSNVTIRDSRMLAFIWTPGDGIGPVMLEGREPRTPTEIALGAKTMRDEHVRIGDRVPVQLSIGSGTRGVEHRVVEYEVVGRAIIPQLFFEPHEPGEGAAMTVPAYARIENVNPEEVPALVRFRKGLDLEEQSRRMAEHGFVAVRQSRGDIATIEKMSAVPLALSGVLAAMAAAALVHTLVTTIRRRRRDLAILKTLGFVRRQLRATVLWQAATLVVAACAIGVPAGIAAGRWAWRLFADQIAVLPQPVVSATYTSLVPPATLLLALAVALGPARRAAKTKPALVLRTE